LRQARAIWHILRAIGPAPRAASQGNRLFRYFVIKALDDAGLIRFLDTPRTYGELLTEFGFTQNEYVDELLATLVKDPTSPITKIGDLYCRRDGVPMQSLNEVLAQTDRRVRPAAYIAEAISSNIVDRLREDLVGVREFFEQDNRRMVHMFQEQLNTRIYTGTRAAAFGYLPDRVRRWLRGKSLINIGCASGRETAEIWLKLGGQVRITAIDAVPSMLELAERNFVSLIDELQPNHPPLMADNTPRFDLADAMRLPYADNTFDSMFWFLTLQWVADPGRAIHEAVRVVRPGGVLFGCQPLRPLVSNYMDLVVRASRNSFGFFWPQDYIHWFTEAGADIDLGPIGIFLARKRAAG